MQTVSNTNFGQLIAYLVPGAIALVGLSEIQPSIAKLFAFDSSGTPTIGGFLYITAAAIAAGMIISAIRWATVDTLHAWTGLPQPQLDFKRLGDNVEAINLLIDIHYRHYLFYANMMVATAIAYMSYCYANWETIDFGIRDFGIALAFLVFAAASRDTLTKYYRRTSQVLAPDEKPSYSHFRRDVSGATGRKKNVARSNSPKTKAN